MPEMPSKEPAQEEPREDQPNEEARELTQTDHLNKKLLSSFLERLNTSNTLDRFEVHVSQSEDGDPQNIEEIVELEEEEALFLEGDGNENTAEQNEEEGDPTSSADGAGKVQEPKKKRVVKRPQPKLNPERLTGPRGIATLENAFKDFKFRGKGHEKEDLDQVMKHLEHWCHRLYPRFQFDDCLEKIETLGHKKPVMTYVKKIRMGMVTGEEAVVLRDEDDAEDAPALDDQPPIDEFDALISQQLSHIQKNAPQPPPSQPSQPSGLTAEQRERMLRNRLLAEERRLARLKAQREKERDSVENSQPTTSVASEKSVNDETLTQSASSVVPEESEKMIIDESPPHLSSSVASEESEKVINGESSIHSARSPVPDPDISEKEINEPLIQSSSSVAPNKPERMINDETLTQSTSSVVPEESEKVINDEPPTHSARSPVPDINDEPLMQSASSVAPHEPERVINDEALTQSTSSVVPEESEEAFSDKSPTHLASSLVPEVSGENREPLTQSANSEVSEKLPHSEKLPLGSLTGSAPELPL